MLYIHLASWPSQHADGYVLVRARKLAVDACKNRTALLFLVCTILSAYGNTLGYHMPVDCQAQLFPWHLAYQMVHARKQWKLAETDQCNYCVYKSTQENTRPHSSPVTGVL